MLAGSSRSGLSLSSCGRIAALIAVRTAIACAGGREECVAACECWRSTIGEDCEGGGKGEAEQNEESSVDEDGTRARSERGCQRGGIGTILSVVRERRAWFGSCVVGEAPFKSSGQSPKPKAAAAAAYA